MSRPIGWSDQQSQKALSALEDAKSLCPATDKDGVEALELTIQELERGLNARQIKFAKYYAAREVNARACALHAGYGEKSAHTRGWELLRDVTVKTLIQCYQRVDALKNGLPISWKRAKLVEIANDQTAPHSSKIQAVRLLAELDGNLRPGPAEGSQILIQMNLLGGQGETFEHESEEPRDDHRLTGGRARNVPTGLLQD